MRYFFYPFLAIASILIDLSCKLYLNWIVAACADWSGNLPRFLRWFQTFDATLDQGMIEKRKDFDNPTWASFYAYPRNGWQIYLNRALWLFRNSAYGFDYYLFGVKWVPSEWAVLRFIDTPSLTLFIATGPGRAFNLFYHGPLGMYKFGWKAWNMFDPSTLKFSGTWGDGGKIPIVFSPNPFKRKRPV